MGCLLRIRCKRQSIPLSEPGVRHVLASSISVPAYASRPTCRQEITTNKTVPMEARKSFMADLTKLPTVRREAGVENCTAEEGKLSICQAHMREHAPRRRDNLHDGGDCSHCGKGERKAIGTKTRNLRHHLRIVRTYFALNAHHRHNKPPKTILPTIPAILTTIHPMNNSYNNMLCAPYMQRLP